MSPVVHKRYKYQYIGTEKRMIASMGVVITSKLFQIAKNVSNDPFTSAEL
jgi:hypothetical protein